MDFEKSLIELLSNVKTVVIEQEKGKPVMYWLPNDKAKTVQAQLEQWQFDSIEEKGVFYALKYQETGGYDLGSFPTLAAVMQEVNPDKGLLLYRVETDVVVEAGGSYFATKLYVGDGEKWVKCDV